jgi:hypothetical protein
MKSLNFYEDGGILLRRATEALQPYDMEEIFNEFQNKDREDVLCRAKAALKLIEEFIKLNEIRLHN